MALVYFLKLFLEHQTGCPLRESTYKGFKTNLIYFMPILIYMIHIAFILVSEY